MKVVRIFRVAGWSLLCAAVLLITLMLLLVIPVDRRPYTQRSSYRQTQESISAIAVPQTVSSGPLRVGYALRNITPGHPVSMAGTGLRKWRAESVHDSLYVRTLVVANGVDTVALVSLDMLIFPPALTRRLAEELPEIGFSLRKTYLGATHTHSGIGNWGEHLAGWLYSGPYDEGTVDMLAEKIIACIAEAGRGMLNASFKQGIIPATGLVYNRLSDEGSVDSLLRVIEITRQDSSKLVFASFTGHATCDRGDSKRISRDYPGVFVDELERNGYSFAMFMAGAVGSHGCRGPEPGRQKIEHVGESLAHTVLDNRALLHSVEDSTLWLVNVPLALPAPQFKIARDWRIRPSLFQAVFGTYPSELTALRIGDLALIGTPCDFSGELSLQLDDVAEALGMSVFITSFNGSYIGYVTVDERYDDNHYETRLMNWYGPWNGAYLTESMSRILEKIAASD